MKLYVVGHVALPSFKRGIARGTLDSTHHFSHKITKHDAIQWFQDKFEGVVLNKAAYSRVIMCSDVAVTGTLFCLVDDIVFIELVTNDKRTIVLV